jgi:hypothetical protein
MSKLIDQFGNPISDSYCTPLWLTARLPMVDVDPCSNPRSTVRARRTYSLEKKLDGLKLSWNGSAFINWPYSAPLPWAAKMVQELLSGRCTEAIILCKLDTSTEWWQVATAFEQPELWTFDLRIPFDEPPALVEERIKKFAEAGKKGGEKSSNNFCSAIIHHRGKAPELQLDEVATHWRRA